jgi:hypothetical protein
METVPIRLIRPDRVADPRRHSSQLEKRPAAVFRTSAPFPPAKSVAYSVEKRAGCATWDSASPTRCQSIGKRPAAVFRTVAPFPPAKSVAYSVEKRAGCATWDNASPTRCQSIEKRPAAVFRTVASLPAAKGATFAACADGPTQVRQAARLSKRRVSRPNCLKCAHDRHA